MAASLDRAAFYKAVRSAPFGKGLSSKQVAGMEAILDAAPSLLGTTSLGYSLATTFHETARTMQPIEEYGRGRGKKYGPTGFWGRGFVQLTWDYNYRKATLRLRELKIISEAEDLVKTPALAMRLDVAAAILFYGMIEGWFTGKKLADYFSGGRYDAVGARHIINGTDDDDLIAAYCGHFVDALRAAEHSVIPTAAAMAVAAQPAPSGSILRTGAQATGAATKGALNWLYSSVHNALKA
ncbi:hypothetical protein [Methylobacterium gnaphalii]|uniref:Glycoside hydrolase family 19 catalytic domain-containing protein n=1 Tax=Methylobacterium gnaphalii TaxID=1010610 RepID=A0A512JIU4_9HYPH|nr:hypothetical protein [Methylobacterium gnaphalii]GEP09792.1 hypothetical protein MGN01_16370 [Methylobacterium gnaphalii]GJD67293.1 hypothetical protein MMMDOFMJ_0207 [Methylobacterium gnaphalii]GLS49822.1 hypothetical protein GCM10007885_26740 [Methylobacterium gnaphalii]